MKRYLPILFAVACLALKVVPGWADSPQYLPAPPRAHLMPAMSNLNAPSVKDLMGMRAVVPVVIENRIDSQTAVAGDRIEARLQNDLAWGSTILARKNARVFGHIVSVESPRTLSHALFSADRKIQPRGCISLQFDAIMDADGKIVPIEALPCRQKEYWHNAPGSQREVRVDNQGRVIRAEPALSEGQKMAVNAGRVVTFAPIPASLAVNIVGIPAAMGTAGAVSPSVAYNKPVDQSVEHRRLKGFTYAFLTSLPGAFFVQSLIEKGNYVVLNAGDLLMIDLCIKDTPYSHLPEPMLSVNGEIISNRTIPTRLYPVDQSIFITRTAARINSIAVNEHDIASENKPAMPSTAEPILPPSGPDKSM